MFRLSESKHLSAGYAEGQIAVSSIDSYDSTESIAFYSQLKEGSGNCCSRLRPGFVYIYIYIYLLVALVLAWWLSSLAFRRNVHFLRGRLLIMSLISFDGCKSKRGEGQFNRLSSRFMIHRHP